MTDGGWLGIAALAVSGILGLLQAREKNRNGDEIRTLQTKQVRCEEESKACRDAHAASQALLESTRHTLALRDEQDKADLQKQIDELTRTKKDKPT